MPTSEIILWAVIGGLLVAVLSGVAVFYNKETPTVKHLSRDFIIGAATTGFLYPLIPDTFDDLKSSLGSIAGSGTGAIADSLKMATTSGDPGVKVGPPNF